MIVVVQIYFCHITWETTEALQAVDKVGPLKLFMGLETGIIDLWRHHHFKLNSDLLC